MLFIVCLIITKQQIQSMNNERPILVIHLLKIVESQSGDKSDTGSWKFELILVQNNAICCVTVLSHFDL